MSLIAVEREVVHVSDSFVNCNDITMILCVRAHEGNPWILERIALMGRYYVPCPPILIVDFGSEGDFAIRIAEICKQNQYSLIAVPDMGVFSLASARNIGFQNTATDFVFFCDPDFFGERDLFHRLATTATALEMRRVVDLMLNPPAYHLAPMETALIEGESDFDTKSRMLHGLGFKLNFSQFNRDDESFIAPYSNIFLINRLMFSMVGGYDSNFRGHGSEDFEFLLRYALHAMHLPVPSSPSSDQFSPWSDEFFSGRPYQGFRRMFELLSQPTESLGFKVFHLWHERRRNSDWYQANDWKRTRLQEATSKYEASRHELLGIDYLERPRKILCLCKNNETWGYFVPLRLAGYQIIPVFSTDADVVRSATRQLVEGSADGVAIFNPYMKSHAGFSSVVASARHLGRKVIVLERGALPSSIYYADDVCYAAASFNQEAFDAEQFTTQELNGADKYIQNLRKGNETLESMDTYKSTEAKYLAFKTSKNKKICFVPLQLSDDMAVTMFIRGGQRYPEFVASLPSLIDSYQDCLFIVKPHPLSGLDDLTPRSNLIISERSDNIHALIDLADVTICYNSGVGLLSLIHGVPTITLGNAFYNLSNAGCHAESVKEGLDKFLAGRVAPPSASLMQRIVAWYIYRKYSFFVAIDDMKTFGEKRKAHGYKDILVTEFRWGSHKFVLDRAKRSMPFSAKSYAGSRIAIGPRIDVAPVDEGRVQEWHKLYQWARKDYHLGHYEKAAVLFVRAHEANPARPNLLRMAAEAFWRAGKKRQARTVLVQASHLLPQNKRVKLRLLSMKYPMLSVVLSKAEMEVPAL